MANKIQKLLFNLSTLSPLLLIFAIVYWLEKDIRVFSVQENKIQISIIAIALIVIIFISAAFSFYSILFVKACHKRLERVPIGVDSIVPNDNWVIVVLLTYALPAASIVFKDINMFISVIVILFWLLLLALSNTILPNPLLMLQGYHFYKMTTIDGSSDIFLLSKRKSVQNRNTVNKVMIAFHYLAIEEKDDV